jgi:hypothetical protein
MPRANRERQSPRCLTENYYTVELQCRLSPQIARHRVIGSSSLIVRGRERDHQDHRPIRKSIAGMTCRIHSRVSFDVGIKVHQTTPRRSSFRKTENIAIELCSLNVFCDKTGDETRLEGFGNLERKIRRERQNTGRLILIS